MNSLKKLKHFLPSVGRAGQPVGGPLGFSNSLVSSGRTTWRGPDFEAKVSDGKVLGGPGVEEAADM